MWPISIPKGDGNGTSGRQNLCCNHWYSFLLRGGSTESHHLLFLRNDKVYVYYVKTQHPVHRTFSFGCVDPLDLEMIQRKQFGGGQKTHTLATILRKIRVSATSPRCRCGHVVVVPVQSRISERKVIQCRQGFCYSFIRLLHLLIEKPRLD